MRVRQPDEFTRGDHARVMFEDCRRVIDHSTSTPALREKTYGGKRLPMWDDAPPVAQIGCGGRVFWQYPLASVSDPAAVAMPDFWGRVGYVGICSHCGWEVYTLDLLLSAGERGTLAAAAIRPLRRRRVEVDTVAGLTAVHLGGE